MPILENQGERNGGVFNVFDSTTLEYAASEQLIIDTVPIFKLYEINTWKRASQSKPFIYNNTKFRNHDNG
jgi:hypothetical protein